MAILTYAEFIAVYPSTGMTSTQIDAFIAVAQAQIERWTGRTFESATYTQYDDGANLPFVMLTNTPVTSITSWKIIEDDASETTIDSTAYRYDPTTGKLGFIDERYGRFAGVWDDRGFWSDRGVVEFGFVNGLADRFRNSKVVYVGGTATASLPADLKQLARDMVTTMIAEGAGGAGPNLSVQSETLGSYSYTRATQAPGAGALSGFEARASLFRRVYV